jgi:hypothetical protein
MFVGERVIENTKLFNWTELVNLKEGRSELVN